MSLTADARPVSMSPTRSLNVGALPAGFAVAQRLAAPASVVANPALVIPHLASPAQAPLRLLSGSRPEPDFPFGCLGKTSHFLRRSRPAVTPDARPVPPRQQLPSRTPDIPSATFSPTRTDRGLADRVDAPGNRRQTQQLRASCGFDAPENRREFPKHRPLHLQETALNPRNRTPSPGVEPGADTLTQSDESRRKNAGPVPESPRRIASDCTKIHPGLAFAALDCFQ